MSETKMDDETLCDSEEEVFCGPITGRELELMTRRKLWFRKTEVFKQKTPRKSRRSRRQSSGTDSDEEKRRTKASTSGWKFTDTVTVKDVQFHSEEMCQGSVEESNNTCNTLAPPPSPEPHVDVYKSTPPKGLKQMIHINEENHTTRASPVTEQISPLLETWEPDAGSEGLQTVDAAETKSAAACGEESLMDVLENITDCGFSSDSLDTTYEEEVDYTSEVDLQNMNKAKINMKLNLTESLAVHGPKINETFVVKEIEGCVSYLKMTNDNLEHSVMGDEDSSEMVQFHAEPDQDSIEGVKMSQEEKLERAVEIVVEDCDMEGPLANIQWKDVMKVIEPLEFQNEPGENIPIAYVKESLKSVSTSVILNIQDEDLAKLVQPYKVHAEFGENLAGMSMTEMCNIQDGDGGELVQPHEVLKGAVHNIDEKVVGDLKDQSKSFDMLETDDLHCEELVEKVQPFNIQREIKENALEMSDGNMIDQLQRVDTLETVKVQEEDEEINELHVYKNGCQDLNESFEVLQDHGHFLAQSYPEIGNENFLNQMVESPEGLIKNLNGTNNVGIGKQEIELICDVDDYSAKDNVEDQEQTMQTTYQEGNPNISLETWDELDHQECVADSTGKQDTLNDFSTSTFQNQELHSFVNVRKKKYFTFFRSSTEDENEVQSPLKGKKESRIPCLFSNVSDDRCSILSTMNDNLIQGMSNVAERAILSSSPTLHKLAEITKKYQYIEGDSAKPEKENPFLNSLHCRYDNTKLTTCMSDLSLRSPRGGHNSSLSSLNESNEKETSPNEKVIPGTNENHLPLMSNCNRLNLSYSCSGIMIEPDVSCGYTSKNDTETPECPAVNSTLAIQSANYSMISEPEDITNEIMTGLPQDVKMFSVLNTIQGNEENGNDMTHLYNNEDLREMCSKTLPGNVSSVSADDDGGFLNGFTEIALHHATLQPASSTPKKYHYSIPVSMAMDVELNTKENMEPDIAQPESPSFEFNDTLDDILMMETYGLDYMLGNKDRFSKPSAAAATCDKSLRKFANDVTLRGEGFDLVASIKTSRQHSNEYPSTHDVEEDESRPVLFENCYKSDENSYGKESMQLGEKPKQDISKSFDANNSQGRVRLFTDLISSRPTNENTSGPSISPGIIPRTPDTKLVRSIVKPKKFFSDKKSSVANKNDNPNLKQANKKDFVFVKPKITVTKPKANYSHETTPVKKPLLLNKQKSPRAKLVVQCSYKGFVSPASNKFKRTPNAGPSSSVSRIPRKSGEVTPAIKKNTYFTQIQSPVRAYIMNSPTPPMVTNKNMPVISATKQIKAAATSGTQKKRLFPDILSLKAEGRSVHYGSENIDTNNVGSVLPQVSYQSAPTLKLDTPSKMKMPHISDSLKRLVKAPMTLVLKHEGRMKLSTLNGGVDIKRSPQRFMPRLAPSNPNDSCVVAIDDDEVSVVVSKEVTRTDTIGH